MNQANLLAAEVIQQLQRRGLWLATAESCTGGMIGHLITEVPGSSAVFAGGVIAYANEAKMSLLDVPAGMLGMYGAVSRETALDMARGVRLALGREMDAAKLIAVSATGIAGPGGGSAEKPVGLVWIGLSAEDYAGAWRYVWAGDRAANKRASAEEALRLALEYLRGEPRSGG